MKCRFKECGAEGVVEARVMGDPTVVYVCEEHARDAVQSGHAALFPPERVGADLGPIARDDPKAEVGSFDPVQSHAPARPLRTRGMPQAPSGARKKTGVKDSDPLSSRSVTNHELRRQGRYR